MTVTRLRACFVKERAHMASVRFEHVSKRFNKVGVVHDITLQARDQEFLVLVGPSGCGKTTCLRMIAGLEEASDGLVWIGERVVNNLPPKAHARHTARPLWKDRASLGGLLHRWTLRASCGLPPQEKDTRLGGAVQHPLGLEVPSMWYAGIDWADHRSEEHTSELQSHSFTSD